MSNVLIAGGGLAGSAVAIQLGRLGVSTELFECGRFPKEKPCGEGLMPAGVAALERLGLNGTKGALLSTEFAITSGSASRKAASQRGPERPAWGVGFGGLIWIIPYSSWHAGRRM